MVAGYVEKRGIFPLGRFGGCRVVDGCAAAELAWAQVLQMLYTTFTQYFGALGCRLLM